MLCIVRGLAMTGESTFYFEKVTFQRIKMVSSQWRLPWQICHDFANFCLCELSQMKSELLQTWIPNDRMNTQSTEIRVIPERLSVFCQIVKKTCETWWNWSVRSFISCRQIFFQMRVQAENYCQRPGTNAVVKNFLTKCIAMISRFAPPETVPTG